MMAATCTLLLSGCIEPVTAIFLLDSSASSAGFRDEAAKTVRVVAKRLEPGIDHLIVYGLNQDLSYIHDGDPWAAGLGAALERYATAKPGESGTAYGTGLIKGLADVARTAKGGGRVVLAVLGDGADERVQGGGNVDWASLPQRFGTFPDNARLAFLFIEPKWNAKYADALKPVLDDRLVMLPPPMAVKGGAVNTIMRLLGR